MEAVALIPFGKHYETGLVVSVDEVQTGQDCNCVCLFCGVPLIAKKGDKNQHHFAHQARDSDEEQHCEASFYRAVFWMIRRIFDESTSISVPKYEIKHFDPETGLRHEYHVTNSSRINFDTVVFPSSFKNYLDDLVIISVAGTRLALSIQSQRNGWLEPGPYIYGNELLAHISIDLSSIKTLFRERKCHFRKTLEELVLYDVDKKQWLYHPREEYFRCIFSEKVKELKLTHQTYKPKKVFTEVNQTRKPKRRITPIKKFGMTTAEESKQRVSHLVSLTYQLFESGVREAVICRHCKAMRTPRIKKCNFCEATEFESIILSESFLVNLEAKYSCWNYGIYSISALKKWPQ